MKRSCTLLFLLLLSCIPAYAQSDWRVFGGFSFNRIDFFPADFSSEPGRLGANDVNMYGWTASVTQYKSPTLNIPADYFGEGVPETDAEIENAAHTAMYSTMIGPSFVYRGSSSVEPFAHVLLGGVYAKAKLSSVGESLAAGPREASDWVFGYAVGGGADFKISKKVALRGQVDWIGSTFSDLGNDRQDNIRISGGLVLHLSE